MSRSNYDLCIVKSRLMALMSEFYRRFIHTDFRLRS